MPTVYDLGHVELAQFTSEGRMQQKNELNKLVHSEGAVASKGPPVVLFPSLAGSVLECEKSPVEGWGGGTRIWMGLTSLLGANHLLAVCFSVPGCLVCRWLGVRLSARWCHSSQFGQDRHADPRHDSW